MIDRMGTRRTSEIARSGEVAPGITYSAHREHLVAACYFAKLARKVESRASIAATQDAISRHRTLVTATILSSVAFLESSINELFLEFRDAGRNETSKLPRRVHKVLAKLWPTVESSPMIFKYQVALHAADAEPFNERRAPYRHAESLIILRDALVHSQPERRDERGRHHRLQRRLRDQFAPSALLPPRALWFPDLCLGAGCAEWAFRTAKSFSDEFCARMSIPARGSASFETRRRPVVRTSRPPMRGGDDGKAPPASEPGRTRRIMVPSR